MKITNKHDLPEPIVRAVSDAWPPSPKRLGATSLIGPPLIRQLKIKHWDELEEDASERLWALLGTAMDNILTQYAPKTWITQLKLEYPVNGITVVGVIDYLILAEGILGDWKATSVWSYLLGGRIEWEKQLNVYDWLLRKSGIVPNKLRVDRLLRDHVANKALRDSEYPKIPFVSLDIPQWMPQLQQDYIEERVQLHQSEPTECTPEEKWQKPTTYAVMKKGRKSALRVLNDENEAKLWCLGERLTVAGPYEGDGLKSNISIAKRLGECTRCKINANGYSYCPVRNFCPYKEKKNG